ncbi:polysaccharide biosynthesis tyrosine autokinase [Cellulomonas endophytica]|uniref:polysaccharide biosynthesis tyrosine autokinase n=1 Tax=Cellulomonas endophytica TaxID=2494735 RepID=UPI00101012D4|nr:polysaccharide biosynthesis tyrosine autokinase [Cellulomonas endophytica]
MELQDYVALLRRRWVSVLAVAAVAVAAALAATLLVTPVYEARSQVFVSTRGGGSTSDLLQGSSFTQNRVTSYADLVTSPRVLVPVIEALGLDTTPDELAESITAASPVDTVLITITVEDPDAARAADIANATATSLATEVTVLEKPEDGASPVQVSVVRPASPAEGPASPDALLNLALGLLLGLAAGVGVAVLRELLDNRVRDEADVARVTSSSVIGTVHHDDRAGDQPLVVHTDPQDHRSEAFRRLRTNLQFLDLDDAQRTIVVTSSLPGEGKSTTSINLALALADAGSRVLLVDADLRRPSVASYMGLEGQVGLTTVLIGRAELDDVVQPWGTGALHVLPSGQVPPNPSELLGSRAMATFLEEAAQRYDVVLVDTAPLLPVTDAAILARLTGGALVVVGAERLHRQQLAQSLGALEAVNARVLGLVLNQVARRTTGGYAYYHYDYSPVTGTDAPLSGRRRLGFLPQQRGSRTGPAYRGSRMDGSQSSVSRGAVLQEAGRRGTGTR